MSVHTPRPWSLAKPNPGMTVILYGPTKSCILGRIHTGSDEYVANAHLIAAAPDMRAALEGLIKAVGSMPIAAGTKGDEIKKAYDNACAAMDKAKSTGEAG